MSAQAGLLELQKALYALLTNAPVLQALVGARIYDVPPPDAAYPLILIGSMEAGQWSTRDFGGAEIVLSIMAFTNKNRGSADVKQIGDCLTSLLDNAETALNARIAAGSVVLCQYDGSAEEETDTGVTWMGTTRFRILLETT